MQLIIALLRKLFGLPASVPTKRIFTRWNLL